MLLCLYVADPATFPMSNGVLGTLFSSENSLRAFCTQRTPACKIASIREFLNRGGTGAGILFKGDGWSFLVGQYKFTPDFHNTTSLNLNRLAGKWSVTYVTHTFEHIDMNRCRGASFHRKTTLEFSFLQRSLMLPSQERDVTVSSVKFHQHEIYHIFLGIHQGGNKASSSWKHESLPVKICEHHAIAMVTN